MFKQLWSKIVVMFLSPFTPLKKTIFISVVCMQVEIRLCCDGSAQVAGQATHDMIVSRPKTPQANLPCAQKLPPSMAWHPSLSKQCVHPLVMEQQQTNCDPRFNNGNRDQHRDLASAHLSKLGPFCMGISDSIRCRDQAEPQTGGDKETNLDLPISRLSCTNQAINHEILIN